MTHFRRQNVALVDQGGRPLSVTNDVLDVIPRDSTTPSVDLFFLQKKTDTTIVGALAIDDQQVTLATGHGTVVGDTIGIFSGSEDSRFYYGIALIVAGDLITLDTPIDFAFTSGSMATVSIDNLNVDGSTTPQTFSIGIGTTGIEIDITRIMIHIVDGAAMDDSKFGGMAALTNGVVMRLVNGTFRNFFNIKTNGRIGLLSFDRRYDDKVGGGNFGMTTRITYAGQEKHGTAIRLTNDDTLDVIIQDDLTDLIEFHIVAQGHISELQPTE